VFDVSSLRDEHRNHLDPLRIVVGDQTPQACWPRDCFRVSIIGGHPVGPVVRLYMHRPDGQESIIALYAGIVLPELPDDSLDFYGIGWLRGQIHAEMLAACGQQSEQD